MTIRNTYADICKKASDENRSLDFYESTIIRYIEADEKTRKEYKSHYQEMHAMNMLLDGRGDLTMFTGGILASISIAEAIIAETAS